MRFWARVLSVTCPLDLALVGVVLELRANNAPDRTRVETKKTMRRSRNVIGVTATWVTRKKFSVPLLMVLRDFQSLLLS